MKDAELDFHLISLDTSIFDAHSDALDQGLLKELDQFATSPVKFCISEIVKRELISHITDRVRKARETVDNAFRKATGELNLNPAKIQKAQGMMKIENSDEEIANQRFESFMDATVGYVIPITHTNLEAITERYFKMLPPFEEKKRYEFPDAIALMSLEEFAKSRKEKLVVVSADKGWQEFCKTSEHLTCIGELGAALNLFQNHRAVEWLIRELSDIAINRTESPILDRITEALTKDVENTQVDAKVIDHTYSITEQAVFANYWRHEFEVDDNGQANINIIRVKQDSIVLELFADVDCDVVMNYTVSYWNEDAKAFDLSTDRKESQVESFRTNIVITLAGDTSKGLEGVAVTEVEIGNSLGFVRFEIDEFDL